MVEPLVQQATEWLVQERLPFEEFRRDSFFFYFTELGEYARPGTSTSTLRNRMEPYMDIPGVAGQFKAIDSIEPSWGSNNAAVMGRRFEIERSYHYASQGMLTGANPWDEGPDLTVTGYGTIKYIQVKWAVDGISAKTAGDVVAQAQNYGGQGEYLLEATSISPDALSTLVLGGGRPLP